MIGIKDRRSEIPRLAREVFDFTLEEAVRGEKILRRHYADNRRRYADIMNSVTAAGLVVGIASTPEAREVMITAKLMCQDITLGLTVLGATMGIPLSSVWAYRSWRSDS